MKKILVSIILFGMITTVWKEDSLKFTRSKDNKTVYAFVEQFPEKELIVRSVTPKKKSKVRMLGYNKPLKWSLTGDGGVRIEIPDALQSPENRPCEYAWAFKFDVETSGAPSCTGREPLKLKVGTYNLRMDTPSDSANAWSYRKEAVKALIRYHDFDLVGTQEGFIHQLRDVCELPEYTYFGAGRDDGKDAGEHSAILYKKDKFTIVDSGNFWLRETPDKPGKGWDATCCNRICSWAKFRERSSGAEFYFFNVHFDHQGITARKESGELMIRKIGDIARGAPVIATGDYNSTPETEQIQALSAFLHDSRSVTEQPPYGPEGTFNRRFSNPIGKDRIDYIFVNEAFRVRKYAVLTDYREFPYYPSDHQPVAVELSLK